MSSPSPSSLLSSIYRTRHCHSHKHPPRRRNHHHRDVSIIIIVAIAIVMRLIYLKFVTYNISELLQNNCISYFRYAVSLVYTKPVYTLDHKTVTSSADLTYSNSL